MRRSFLFDGKTINPFNLDSNVGWTAWGTDAEHTTEADLFRSVPWLYRAVNDRAHNVGTVPFEITRNGEPVDMETDTLFDFLDGPARLFTRLEMSLTMTGRAFAKVERNNAKYIRGLRYLVPSTVEPVYSPDTGELVEYRRRVNARVETLRPEDVLAIYIPDYTSEVGAGSSSPAMAAMLSAGVLRNSDEFVRLFFERGAIKATVLTTTTQSQLEAERLQHWWDDVVSGVRNAWSALVVRGSEVKPVVIGEGLESLGNEALTVERRQNIATAIGVPESRLWSSAANYATRREDEKAYYTGTIIPECDLIAEAVNKQIFTRSNRLDGYKFRFKPETLDVFRSDIAEQISALTQLTTERLPLEIALELVGIDLTDEQRQRLAANVIGGVSEAQEEAPAEAVAVPDVELKAALTLWKRKAIAGLKRNGSADVEFISSVIEPSLAGAISGGLSEAKTSEDVGRIFHSAIEWRGYP